MDGDMPDMSGRPPNLFHPNIQHILQRDIPPNVKSNVAKPVKESFSKGQYGHSSKYDVNNMPTADSEEAELQKAIALSLQNEGNLNNYPSDSKLHKDDLARALTQSLAHVGTGVGIGGSGDCPNKRTDNPHHLLRTEKDWPTGLKNVGNTCWFNVVVQSLYHLPWFRYIILKFGSIDLESASSETQKNVKVFQELRNLFALMLASKRSFLDPQNCIDMLQKTFLSESSETQQDVNEFLHMLLNVLEDVYRLRQEIERKQESGEENRGDPFSTRSSDQYINVLAEILPGNKKKPMSNPVLELFYGTTKSVGTKNGQNFEHESRFSILPLCVVGYRNLHESLEHATAKGNVEGEKEMWFSKVPPVLTFQLSRFSFNHELGTTEKLHDRLIFPSVLYMDRYMESNMEVTRQKREEVKQLSMQLHDLRLKLCRSNSTYHNGKTYNISEVLLCCANYAAVKQAEEPNPASPIPSRLSRRRSGSGSPSFGLSPNKRTKEDDDDDTADAESNSVECGSPDELEGVEFSEAAAVESTLRNWKNRLDEEVADLRSRIKQLESEIDKMYDETPLRQHPYTLHAVLIHQGQALAGHYWAYIRDYGNQRWLRFNDTMVSEASFEQLATESVGGHSTRFYNNGNHASAYCLVYINSKRTDLMADWDCQEAIASDPVLSDLINDHNSKVENELEHWDVESAKQISLMECSNLPRTDRKPESRCGDGALDLAVLKNAIDRVDDTYKGSGPEKALEQNRSERKDAIQLIENRNGTSENESATLPEKEEEPLSETEDHPASDKEEECASRSSSVENYSPPLSPRRSYYSYFDDDDESNMCPVFQSCLYAIMKAAGTYNLEGPLCALEQVISEEMVRLQLLSEEPDTLISDPRLQNIVVYLYQNKATKNIIERCVLEQFTDKRLRYDRRSSEIMKCAVEKLGSDHDENMQSDIRNWRLNYDSFCKATCHMLRGLSLFHSRSFYQASLHFIAVYSENKNLSAPGQPRLALDSKFVRRYCRTCIQRVSEEAMSKLRSKSKDEALQGIDVMREQLIPCISSLLSCEKGGGAPNDLQLADNIRDDWCSLLEQSIVLSRDELSTMLAEFLDVNPDTTSIKTPAIDVPINIAQQFETVMSSLLHEPD